MCLKPGKSTGPDRCPNELTKGSNPILTIISIMSISVYLLYIYVCVIGVCTFVCVCNYLYVFTYSAVYDMCSHVSHIRNVCIHTHVYTYIPSSWAESLPHDSKRTHSSISSSEARGKIFWICGQRTRNDSMLCFGTSWYDRGCIPVIVRAYSRVTYVYTVNVHITHTCPWVYCCAYICACFEKEREGLYVYIYM